jgi:hypothetical protein
VEDSQPSNNASHKNSLIPLSKKTLAGPNKPLRWLTIAFMVQATILFLVSMVLANRVRAIQRGIRDLLFSGSVPAELVDRVNQIFIPILNELVWLFWGGMILTSMGYALLRYLIIKNWPNSP